MKGLPYASPAVRSTSDETAAVYGCLSAVSRRHAERLHTPHRGEMALANPRFDSAAGCPRGIPARAAKFAVRILTAVKWQRTDRSASLAGRLSMLAHGRHRPARPLRHLFHRRLSVCAADVD